MPAPPSITPPAAFCGFKVRVRTPVNKEFVKNLKSSAGNLTSLSLRGHVLVDVCAALS